MDLQLTRLGGVDPADIIALMSHRAVRRHMPLAEGAFGAAECAAFVTAKEALWRDHGYGPWAFLVDGEFAGWGGLQPEDGGDADLALVLHPRFWGHGRAICARVLDEAFGTFRFDSVTILLPPTRRSGHAVARLGFRTDGETSIEGRRFLRFRLHSADRPRP
ncbi:GNAT family N-acetyltransferase [Catellatospora sichuanensis]|uniref:GNAT family N-acetyltransferase n=1 Tax=Catellatospora sichuanensis TaxID=1969805 RepID=UPI001181F766|nr:GNAT family N-acetyltransferase [Catellatospora sichuanensis]